MSNFQKELAFAKQLAVDAKAISDKYYKTALEFETKSDASPVTIADKAVNSMVIERVKVEFPEHGVLGEELSWQETRELLWVCDPIDGTIAFSMGEPTFMFSIALVKDGVPIVAVASNLASGELFWATKGGGAFADNKPIKVSSRPLDKSWLVFSTKLKTLFAYQALYAQLDKLAYQTNVIHGGVFKGMLIAQGLADGVVYRGSTSPWDIAAVKLIVEEAGGKVTGIEGQACRYDQPLPGGSIVSNGTIHSDLLAVVQDSKS